MRNNFFLLFILMCSLFGCAHQTLTPVINNVENYQQRLTTLTHWQLQGKIGVRHANKSDSAALEWKQSDEHFDIFLSGPLGAGATRLTGTPKKLAIQNSAQETTSTSDPEQLIEKHLGWTLPLEKLPQWIVGYSDNEDARLNNDNTVAGFSEQDWQVDYLSYQTVNQWLLPEKIVLKHEDMQVTIVIKHWTID